MSSKKNAYGKYVKMTHKPSVSPKKEKEMQ